MIKGKDECRSYEIDGIFRIKGKFDFVSKEFEVFDAKSLVKLSPKPENKLTLKKNDILVLEVKTYDPYKIEKVEEFLNDQKKKSQEKNKDSNCDNEGYQLVASKNKKPKPQEEEETKYNKEEDKKKAINLHVSIEKFKSNCNFLETKIYPNETIKKVFLFNGLLPNLDEQKEIKQRYENDNLYIFYFNKARLSDYKNFQKGLEKGLKKGLEKGGLIATIRIAKKFATNEKEILLFVQENIGYPVSEEEILKIMREL